MESVIFYIIAGVAYLIFKNVANKNKKNTPKPTPKGKSNAPSQKQPKPNKQPETFGDLLGELFGIPTEPSPTNTKETQQQKPVAQPQKVETKRALNQERKVSEIQKRKAIEEARLKAEKQRKELLNIERKKAAQARALVSKDTLKEKQQEFKRKSVKKKTKFKFDIKQAIISKAILERPYQ